MGDDDDGSILERESKDVAMDTPQRKQTNTPLSKLEESPVFNYLNNLSPIVGVRSVHITQTINSLNFASLPSVFTSPHVSTVKDSKFLRRHQLPDPSKLEFSSENVNKVGKQQEVLGIAEDSSELRNFGPVSAAAEPPYLPNELPRTVTYESVNRDSDLAVYSVMETKCGPELTGLSSALGPSVHIDSRICQIGSEINVEGVSHFDEEKEVSGCDWENLLSDEGNLSIFESPIDSESLKDPSQKLLEPGMSCCTSVLHDLHKSIATQAVNPCQLSETDHLSFQRKESNMNEIAENGDLLVSLSNCVAGDTNEIVDAELASNMHRGLRRRCLVFEMAGSRRKPLTDISNVGPSMLSHPHYNPKKPKHDIPGCNLSGIGLHLNALASTSVNHEVAKSEALTTDRQPISSSDIDMLPAGEDMSLVEDAGQALEDVVNEALDHNSPKKKRHKLESGEGEACKRCKCKKSKCLKLYCECFAAGVYCIEPCACHGCFNKPIHEDVVLAARTQIESRNPLAFAPKVIRSSESVIEIREESGKTPASARHKRGCNCKKSGCTKKYCECYQGGVGCSVNCRCEQCKNAFGSKHGYTPIGMVVELEKDIEGEACKSVIDRSLHIITVQNGAEQNTKFALPETPLLSDRQLIELPLSTNSMRPPRSTFQAAGSSSQEFKKRNPSHAKFEKNITAREDEMSEILQPSIGNVKSVSPNSKRVSPTHGNTGFAPGLRGSRKLILQSIPSFPSLTPKH
ncbi:CRC domain-containing protein [Heracleum sosnowskyi]|uniref:CRC domain-containing protein n=1 Tax=Heracleum sosnowskyi TaxID=360622 RepID=A0AAD8J2R7_9APIA|nr:CRC domain-containing protein [Heracleum sosnowskyi]